MSQPGDRPGGALTRSASHLQLAHGSLRLTIGSRTGEEDIDYVIGTLFRTIDSLRARHAWNSQWIG
jgi:cysteine sulfinate desulfinase/cysteine desulfurase-like protein